MSAARHRFAVEGYASTTLSAVAHDVGISLAALYHYFDSKRELYEAVFDESIDAAWTATRQRVEKAREQEPGLLGLVHAIDEAGSDLDAQDQRATNMFLTTVPIEAARHKELSHLLDKRAAVQDREIRAIVAPAFDVGELPAFEDIQTAVEAVRLVIMGWSLETFLNRDRESARYDAVTAVLKHFATPAPPVQRRRRRKIDGRSR